MEFVINQNLVTLSCRGMCGTKLKNRRALVLYEVVSHAVVSCRVALSFKVINLWFLVLSQFFRDGMGPFKLSSHMCDMTRHDSMRHDMTEDQGTTIF